MGAPNAMHVLPTFVLFSIAVGAVACGDRSSKGPEPSGVTPGQRVDDRAPAAAPEANGADASEPLPRSDLERSLDQLEQQISGVSGTVGGRR